MALRRFGVCGIDWLEWHSAAVTVGLVRRVTGPNRLRFRLRILRAFLLVEIARLCGVERQCKSWEEEEECS